MALKLPRTRSCFVCGVGNPLGLNLAFQSTGTTVTAVFRPRAEHVGFKRVVHGGLIATVLDEAMVWACGVFCKVQVLSDWMRFSYSFWK